MVAGQKRVVSKSAPNILASIATTHTTALALYNYTNIIYVIMQITNQLFTRI